MAYCESTKMIKVTDDWYPNFDEDKIKVSIIMSYHDNIPANDEYPYDIPAGGFVKIVACGADDTGVELEQRGEFSQRYFEYIYNFWKENIFDKIPNGINIQWFYEHGFLDW